MLFPASFLLFDFFKPYACINFIKNNFILQSKRNVNGKMESEIIKAMKAERRQPGWRRVRSGATSGLRDGLRATAASPGPAGGAAAGAVHGSGPFGLAFDSGLEIKTRSVEQTLLPLVSQITTLINHKDNTKKSDKTLQAIQRVGQAVNLAVGRFVKVGEAIANENWDLKEEINIACTEAKQQEKQLLHLQI